MINLKKLISATNWHQLYLLDNVDSAYQFFKDSVTKCYHTCFPSTKLSRKRSKNKMWMTSEFKLSSKHKNKLYKKWLTSKTLSDKVNYKNYRELFKQIAGQAEQTYFKQLFDTRTNTTNQL